MLGQQGGDKGSDQQGVMFGQGGMEQKQWSPQMSSLGVLVQQGGDQGSDQQGVMFGQGEMEHRQQYPQMGSLGVLEHRGTLGDNGREQN